MSLLSSCNSNIPQYPSLDSLQVSVQEVVKDTAKAHLPPDTTIHLTQVKTELAELRKLLEQKIKDKSSE